MNQVLISSPSELSPAVAERWGGMLGSQQVAQKLMGSARLNDRVLRRLFAIFGVSEEATATDASAPPCASST